MYNNIGGKIKVVAVVSAALETFAFIVGGIYCGTISLIVGLPLIFIGPLVAWVGSLVLFGFGELIEKVTEISNTTKAQLGLTASQSSNLQDKK